MSRSSAPRTMIPAISTTNARMTFEPSSSSVSIRFWTSIADSSWAVPSVASRSRSALTMPWTNSTETRRATTATMTITRMWIPLSRRTSTIVLTGGFVKSIGADGSPCRASRRATVVLGVALVVGGCAGPVVPSSIPSADGASQSPAEPAEPTIRDLAARLAPILDPDSRDLLTVIEPEESIQGMLTGGDASTVAAAAAARGLTASQIASDTALVSGPVLAVLAFALAARPTDLSVFADDSARRWIPDLRPTVPIPVSGSPYVAAPVTADRSELRMDLDHQNAFLRLLAASIRTIDGRPYDRITVSGECSGRPSSCTVRASGWTAASGGRPDTFSLLSD